MMTSCAVRILHSSAVLCNQIPWYLPRLQGSAVNRKNFYVETKMVGVAVWGLFFFILVSLSFRKAIKHEHSSHMCSGSFQTIGFNSKEPLCQSNNIHFSEHEPRCSYFFPIRIHLKF